MADIAERLAQARSASIVAPAGCGKTETIARAVKVSTGRQLVLTHTHAGVNALRSRMRKLHVPAGNVSIQTIDGWSLKMAIAFPTMSQLTNAQPEGSDWAGIRAAANQLIRYRSIASIIRASYTGVYVDEYQDCTLDQHCFVSYLSTLLPVRILGDPLQSVFSFAGNEIVDWRQHVTPVFPQLATLSTPYRWTNGNMKLGQWLITLRESIYGDVSVDLTDAPIVWQQSSTHQCLAGCRGCALCGSFSRDETVVLLRKWPSTCRRVARSSGRYQAIEEMGCRRLMEFARKLDAHTGAGWAKGVLTKFIGQCYTQTDQIVKHPVVQAEMRRVTDSAEEGALLSLFHAVEHCGLGRLYCPDLWYEAKRALRLRTQAPDRYASLHDAAWQAREMTRRSGRKLPSRVASTTLLVKGLEFDHAVISDAADIRKSGPTDGFMHGARSFYVAATRSARSLTVMSHEPVLTMWHV